MNQIMCKVAPALAAGCTMVLKPSEIAPLSGIMTAEVLHEAGVPAGVFNLVNGDGPMVGAAMAAHPGIDMVSFTGSTRAGIAGRQGGRRHREARRAGARRQVGEHHPRRRRLRADGEARRARAASTTAASRATRRRACSCRARASTRRSRSRRRPPTATVVGDPQGEKTNLGPVVSKAQFEKIQGLIEKGIDEGAELVAGGPGRPRASTAATTSGRPSSRNVRNDMTIAREEIFGPVLCILPYDTEDDAIRIANDTPYGLSGYVSSGDPERALRVASRLRTGNVHLNGATVDFAAPFGGYKQSGNGREWGEFGFEEFLEVKAVMGVGK